MNVLRAGTVPNKAPAMHFAPGRLPGGRPLSLDGQDCRRRNHVTLINDNIGRFPPEAMPQLEKLARLAGARLVLREVAHEKELTPASGNAF
ncbi:MAG TPA: hypothetical protein VJA21_32210 [Verrucomicrobiae bacterium]